MRSGRRSAPPDVQGPPRNMTLVEGNIRSSSAISWRRGDRVVSKSLTIDDAPMMLLPKARVSDNREFYQKFKSCRAFSVEANTETQGLHISTVQSADMMRLRTPTKSSLKPAASRRCSSSLARSEADSGIGSLKRSVTFDNLSQSRSTDFRSEEDLDTWSSLSQDGRDDMRPGSQEQRDDSTLTVRLPRIDDEGEFPHHLDTFGDNKPVLVPVPSPPKSILARRLSRSARSSKRRRNHGDHHCEICGMDLSDEQKVKKVFGEVDPFVDWVMSKFGKRRELQFLPRPTFVYRGNVPHFCNFVRQVPLHNKLQTGTDSTGLPEDSELGEEVDLLATEASLDGSPLGQWRKTSSASSIPEQKEDGMDRSGTEGRPGSPSSISEQDEEKETSSPVTEVRVTPSKPRPDSGLLYRAEDRGDNSIRLDALYSNVQEESEEEVESSRPSDPMTIPEVVTPPPPDTPASAWNNDLDKATQAVNIPSGGNSTDDNAGRESPRQPPPTPEPQPPPPKPPETPPPAKRRACVTKKTKKPIERVRKKKEMELPPEPEPPKKVEQEPAPPGGDEGLKVDTKIELKVPELPSPPEKKEPRPSSHSKPNKHLIQADNDFDPYRLDPGELLDDQLRSMREVDWTNMDTNGMDDVKRPPQIKSWIQGRLALSQQSSRFELPMDMKKLETMTPQEYVKSHCIITSRRANLYQKIFLKNKDKSTQILFKDIDRSLKDVLVNTITSEQIEELLRTLEITEQTKVDYKLFAGMAAYAERVLYPRFVTEDTRDTPEYQREKIECADFSALDWKFHGVNVNPAMAKLLRQIR